MKCAGSLALTTSGFSATPTIYKQNWINSRPLVARLDKCYRASPPCLCATLRMEAVIHITRTARIATSRPKWKPCSLAPSACPNPFISRGSSALFSRTKILWHSARLKLINHSHALHPNARSPPSPLILPRTEEICHRHPGCAMRLRRRRERFMEARIAALPLSLRR